MKHILGKLTDKRTSMAVWKVKKRLRALPNKRTREDIAKALDARGLSTEGKEGRIAGSLSRRVKKGVLRAAKGPKGWVY